MKNVTVSLDEALLTEAKVKAARAGKSLSRYMAGLVEADVTAAPKTHGSDDRNAQMEALERFLSGPKWSVLREGRMPTADERNER